MASRVLIIDDEEMFREDLALLLTDRGYTCETAADGEQGVRVAAEFEPEVILCDIVMPRMGGVEAVGELVRICPEACVLMITAHGTMETAVEAFRKGATDYILKPIVLEDVLSKIERYLEHRHLRREVRALRRELQREEQTKSLIGKSAVMEALYRLIDKVAQTDSTVLITGESGTGKELVARAVHEGGESRERAFVAVNCASLPESLIESELFEHVKGAFTGANEDRVGLFEVAEGGTLFLDEITEMEVGVQAKLLRVIEQKEVRRLGGSRTVHVQTRVMASSNRDLKKAVQEGSFRVDLYFRLRVIEIDIPPLRERREDIPSLAEHFVQKYNAQLKKRFLGVDAEAMRILMLYSWPGNVRELENAIERAMILADGEFVSVVDLPPDVTSAVQFPKLQDDLRDAVRAYEREHIRQVLSSCGGNREETARRLGINPSTLYRKMTDLAVDEG